MSSTRHYHPIITKADSACEQNSFHEKPERPLDPPGNILGSEAGRMYSAAVLFGLEIIIPFLESHGVTGV